MKPADDSTTPAPGEHELDRIEPPKPIEEDLMALARLGELRAIQKLFDSGKYNANSADEQGITALHVSLSLECLVPR